MKVLVDSHILLWLGKNQLTDKAKKAKALFDCSDYTFYFSSVNLWEIAIKASLSKPDFDIVVEELEQGLLKSGFYQLYIDNKHIFEIKNLPHIHKDPFDRLLIAQAKVECFHFLTVDEKILQYGYDFVIDAS
ncbi:MULTISPECIES: type II toxin-antitoxin system VapC family toxin [unclassified Moraxella]|uniref:type II toxin-antitoxin system VapC family toxin n=1 Tax=unclassified Moraxella TaxID=2685852 RepID=UPI003AF9A115